MAGFPENFRLIHEGEESIRLKSIATIEADDDLSLHAEAVEGAVSTLRYYIMRDDHRDEDDLFIRALGIRMANALTGAMQHLLAGYYQLAAMVARDLVETSFMVEYFSLDRTRLTRWRTCTDKERKAEFKPVAIRTALDKHHKHEGLKRAEAYELFSQLAGHPHPKGFAMLKGKDGLLQCGPFFDPTALSATLSELAKQSVIAGESFQTFFTRSSREDYENMYAYFMLRGRWFERFYDRPFDKKLAAAHRATIDQLPW